MKETVEMWLPTSITKVTVTDGKVTVWDEMTMERRVLPQPVGFAKPPEPPEEIETDWAWRS